MAGVAVALGAACGGDGGPDPGDAPHAVDRDEARLTPELVAFLERIEAATEVAFTARYDVLRKLGGEESVAEVVQRPPRARIAVGDLVVATGPDPSTCRLDTGDCVDDVDEAALAGHGLSSRFFAAGPAQQLRATASRDDADPPVFRRDRVAGVEVDCVEVAVAGTTAITTCATGEGVIAFHDAAPVRIELTEYHPEADPDASFDPTPSG